MSSEARSHATNAIWLCQTCAKWIDNDVQRFPTELLLKWKESAELAALSSLGKAATRADASLANILPEEIDILCASADKGEIHVLEVDELSPRVIINNIIFADDGDPAYAAAYFEALESLVARRLVRHDEGILYVLTGTGFKVARSLNQARLGAGKSTQTVAQGVNGTRPAPKFTLHTLAPTAVAGHTSVALDVNVFRSKAHDQPSYMFAALIAFENRAVSTGDGDVKDVWAEIIFRESSSRMEMSRIASACWIDHPLADIDFPLNTPRYLFVGGWEIIDKNFASDIKLFEFSRSMNRPIEKKASFQGHPHDLIMDVTLTPNGYHEAAQRFQFSFRLLSRGTYSIRPLAGLTT
jgi:hypothetical protein